MSFDAEISLSLIMECCPRPTWGLEVTHGMFTVLLGLAMTVAARRQSDNVVPAAILAKLRA